MDLIKDLFTGKKGHSNFFLIAGPCVIEEEQLLMDIAARVGEICNRYQVPFIFKASYRKGNRTRVDSFTGIGDIAGLELLKKIGHTFSIPVTTDIHSAQEAAIAAPYADILQIPAFLCRQTDILMAAARTGRAVNVKKGQFVSGQAMGFAVQKIRNEGNELILLTERGTTFGYQDLVVDFRNIPWMQEHGVPVVVDCTHSLQQPNQQSGITGGNPTLIGTIARAAIAAGADGLFIETHPEPSMSRSDGANMLRLDRLEELVKELVKISKAVTKDIPI
ncbi:MAG TPA: 3-deoxy-8-phosphooctulonate synthase [Chitinophagaceae bacterium]|nr:3-deoxy-8-phosphooctulonate synthase [Chitinophagaceae bacterium]